MNIYLAADHAGFELKEKMKEMLMREGYRVTDKGAHVLDPEDDYPAYMSVAAKAVATDMGSVGILFGGSGEGEAIVANRIQGIRAAVFYGLPKEIIVLSREHNDANILSIGARFLTEEQTKDAITLWLKTPFSGEKRHARRIAQIDKN